jgi:hypothetical protein
LKTGMEIGTVFFLYGVIRFHDKAELWVYIMFVMFAPTFICLLTVGVTYMSHVNELSLKLLHEFKFTGARHAPDQKRLVKKMVINQSIKNFIHLSSVIHNTRKC